jgi:hypothetical protein
VDECTSLIMGNGLIPAPKEVWAARRPTVGAAFHGAWLKHVGCPKS